MKIGKATYCNVICAFAGAEAILCITLTPPCKLSYNQIVSRISTARSNILALPQGTK